MAGRGVVRGGGLGLGDHLRGRHAGELGDLVEQRPAERAPVGRVGEHDALRRGALGLHDAVDHVGEQRAEQRRDRVRGAAEHDRGRVAEAALELAADPVRAAHRAPARRVARHHGAVLADVHHRRGDHRPVPEGEHLHPRRVRDRRRDERRAEVHAQAVRHPRLLRWALSTWELDAGAPARHRLLADLPQHIGVWSSGHFPP